MAENLNLCPPNILYYNTEEMNEDIDDQKSGQFRVGGYRCHESLDKVISILINTLVYKSLNLKNNVCMYMHVTQTSPAPGCSPWF